MGGGGVRFIEILMWSAQQFPVTISQTILAFQYILFTGFNVTVQNLTLSYGFFLIFILRVTVIYQSRRTNVLLYSRYSNEVWGVVEYTKPQTNLSLRHIRLFTNLNCKLRRSPECYITVSNCCQICLIDCII